MDEEDERELERTTGCLTAEQSGWAGVNGKPSFIDVELNALIEKSSPGIWGNME